VLVIIKHRSRLSALVNAPSDILGSPLRTNAEKALDRSLSRKSVLNIDRRIITDLASLDGALVIDGAGSLLAYGAMVKSKQRTEAQGSRTRAAEGASKLGLAIKVSSDGGISMYLAGKPRLAF
jgi:DNA integrity scanning protein DisA with diadenylate cyclase activity